MKHKLKKRFILFAMSAFGLVTCLMVTAINLLNASRVKAEQRQALSGILEYRNMVEAAPDDTHPHISEMPWAGGDPQREFTFRFFEVRCTKYGDLIVLNRDYISSVDDEIAESYTKHALSKGKAEGVWQDYRYLMASDGDGIRIVFLNISDSKAARRTLFAVSVCTGFVCLLVVFLFSLLFAERAVAPFIRNTEEQKRFITDAGHELKTPITSISTSADIILMEDEANEWAENIRKQTERLRKLVEKLVMLSRLDEEQPFRDTSEFSLTDAVWEISESFGPRIKASGKRFEQKLQDGLTLTGDRAAIQQLVSLLLDNALRYSDEKGLIHLSLFRQRRRLCLEVYNTCELPEGTDLSRLFDRFYRPDGSRTRDTGGSGIGLSIVKAIVQRHGGTVTAETPDRRSILFRVIL